MSKEFASEAEMCRVFIDALPRSWTPLAEWAGWDILLVRRQDGFQIGIQAKLRANVEVVNQAREKYYGPNSSLDPGPDCRAVLVPSGGADIGGICRDIGIAVIRMHTDYPYVEGPPYSPELPRLNEEYVSMYGELWPEWCPAKRHKLPDYVPDVAAGARAPIQLSPQKIQRIKLAILLERNGRLIRKDFAQVGADPRPIVSPARGYLVQQGEGWVRGPKFPDVKAQHPRVYAEIAADWEKWTAEKPKARQQSLDFGG